MKRFDKFAPQRGFTLIELVMVIVLVGILAAVAIPNFGGLSDDAKLGAANGVAGSAAAAIANQAAACKGGVGTGCATGKLTGASCTNTYFLTITDIPTLATIGGGPCATASCTVSYDGSPPVSFKCYP